MRIHAHSPGPRGRTCPRSGFTLLEVLVAAALAGVLLFNIQLLVNDAREDLEDTTLQSEVNLQAQRALDRIALAVMGALASDVHVKKSAPDSSDTIHYTSVVGFEGGQPVISEPQSIALTAQSGREVSWYSKPGTSEETRVVWARHLREFCAGEVANGLDDNGNGLVDEKGLAFEVDGPMVTICLTIERLGRDGKLVTKRLETRVTCRN